jgi:hypothetical protein
MDKICKSIYQMSEMTYCNYFFTDSMYDTMYPHFVEQNKAIYELYHNRKIIKINDMTILNNNI